jgi:hypothetical protein
MSKHRLHRHIPLFALGLISCTLLSCSHPPAADSATFDPDGTAHITRTIPMPSTISPEAQSGSIPWRSRNMRLSRWPNAARPQTNGARKTPRKRESSSP